MKSQTHLKVRSESFTALSWEREQTIFINIKLEIMATFDDEYLEVFGGDHEVYETVAAKIRTDVFEPLENEKCSHKNIETFPDGQGYCTDCGVSFRDVSRFRTTSSDDCFACLHENTYEDDNGLHVCRDCNTEIEVLDFEPEWRYYGSADNRSVKNPERCHRSRASGRGISKVFEELRVDAPEAIKAQVESRYNAVVGDDTVRGKGRKGIIAACLFYAYKEFGEYRTSDYVRELFKLTKKQMSAGLGKYCRAFPEARTLHTRPENLLRWILTLTGVNQEHYRKIVQISRYLEGSSRLLKRSSPQSVASAIVYFYLCLNPEYKSHLGLTKNRFAEKALLSDITVTKLVKEAAVISQCVVLM